MSLDQDTLNFFKFFARFEAHDVKQQGKKFSLSELQNLATKYTRDKIAIQLFIDEFNNAFCNNPE